MPKRLDIFPTPIMSFDNLGVLDDVINFGNLPINFHNQDILPIFKQKMIDCATEYFKLFNPLASIKIKRSWVTTNGYLEGMGVHNHKTTLIAGVYYLNTAPLCGDLILLDPRAGTNWPETKEYSNTFITSSNKKITTGERMYRVSPEPDKLIIFPGYMLHLVETNLNPNFVRRSIGMNFQVIQ